MEGSSEYKISRVGGGGPFYFNDDDVDLCGCGSMTHRENHPTREECAEWLRNEIAKLENLADLMREQERRLVVQVAQAGNMRLPFPPDD